MKRKKKKVIECCCEYFLWNLNISVFPIVEGPILDGVPVGVRSWMVPKVCPSHDKGEILGYENIKYCPFCGSRLDEIKEKA